MNSLSDEELAQFANRVAEEIAGKRRAQWIDPQTHHEHHEWVKIQKSREEEFKALRQKIITSACLWAVPIVCAFILSVFWREFVRIINDAPGS